MHSSGLLLLLLLLRQSFRNKGCLGRCHLSPSMTVDRLVGRSETRNQTNSAFIPTRQYP